MCTSSEGGQQLKARGDGGSKREHGGDSGGVTSPALQLPAAGAKAARPFHDSACANRRYKTCFAMTHPI